MAYKNDIDDEKKVEYEAPMTDEELKELDAELETYRVKKILSDGTEANFIDEYEWLVWRDAMTQRDGEYRIKVLYEGSKIHQPILYDVLQNRLGQWRKWRSKRDYANRKELEELDQTPEAIAARMKSEAQNIRCERII